MLSNRWYPPEDGNRSSTDDGKVDTDDDTQIMEPDQGNGELLLSPVRPRSASDHRHSPLAPHLPAAPRCRPEPRHPTHLHPRTAKHARANNQVGRPPLPAPAQRLLTAENLAILTLFSSSFMCHPEMLLHIPRLEDPVERFVSVVKFYLSGWHIRPPFVHSRPLHRAPVRLTRISYKIGASRNR